MDRLILIIMLITLTTMVYIQYDYIQADWCSNEIDVLRTQLSDIWYMHNLDMGVVNEPR